jgi:membrane-associated phospholipid phosphatase
LKYWREWTVPALCAAGFLAIALSASNQSVFVDINRLGPATSDWLWANITVIGDTLVAFALCLPLWRRRPDLVWAFVFVVLLGTLWARGFKLLVDVPRPPAVLGESVHVIGQAYRADSFPSGHATAAFAIGGLLVLGLRSLALTVLVLLVAVLASLSRAVVGVHWPLDILGGALGGWLSALLGLWIARRTLRFGLYPEVQWVVGLFLIACAAWLVIGHDSGYPQADLFQRALGICCLVSAASTLVHASLRRRPGL